MSLLNFFDIVDWIFGNLLIGGDYVGRMNLYISHFSDGVLFLILRYIKKMATDVEGGVVDGRARRFQARILVLG